MLSFYKHARTNKVNEEMEDLKFPTDFQNMEFVEGTDDGFYQSFDDLETDFDEMKDYDIVYKDGEGGIYLDGEIKSWEGSIGQAVTKIHQTLDKFGEVIDEFDGEITSYRASASNSYTQRSNIKTEFGDVLVVMTLTMGSLNYDVRHFSIRLYFNDNCDIDNFIEEAEVAGLSKAFDEGSPVKEAELREEYDYEIPFKFLSNTNFSEAFGSDEDDEVDWSLLEDISTYDEDLKEEVEEAREEETEDELVQKYNDEGIKREDVRPHIDDIRETLVEEYKKTIKFVNEVNK